MNFFEIFWYQKNYFSRYQNKNEWNIRTRHNGVFQNASLAQNKLGWLGLRPRPIHHCSLSLFFFFFSFFGYRDDVIIINSYSTKWIRLQRKRRRDLPGCWWETKCAGGPMLFLSSVPSLFFVLLFFFLCFLYILYSCSSSVFVCFLGAWKRSWRQRCAFVWLVPLFFFLFSSSCSVSYLLVFFSFLFLFPLSLCSSGALCLCLSSSVYGPLCCLSSPLRGLFSGFYCQRMPSVRAYWGWGIAAGRRGPWLKRFWCLNCWNGSWGRRRWIVFETALFVSWKWLFSICPMNVWHLIIGPLFKDNFLLFFFFNFSPGSNWNWTPEFQCHLQTSH